MANYSRRQHKKELRKRGRIEDASHASTRLFLSTRSVASLALRSLSALAAANLLKNAKRKSRPPGFLFRSVRTSDEGGTGTGARVLVLALELGGGKDACKNASGCFLLFIFVQRPSPGVVEAVCSSLLGA